MYMNMYMYVRIYIYVYVCVCVCIYICPEESLEDWGQGGQDKRRVDGFTVVVTQYGDLCTAY